MKISSLRKVNYSSVSLGVNASQAICTTAAMLSLWFTKPTSSLTGSLTDLSKAVQPTNNSNQVTTRKAYQRLNSKNIDN